MVSGLVVEKGGWVDEEDVDGAVRVEFAECVWSVVLRGLSVTASFNCINASVDVHE